MRPLPGKVGFSYAVSFGYPAVSTVGLFIICYKFNTKYVNGISEFLCAVIAYFIFLSIVAYCLQIQVCAKMFNNLHYVVIIQLSGLYSLAQMLVTIYYFPLTFDIQRFKKVNISIICYKSYS